MNSNEKINNIESDEIFGGIFILISLIQIYGNEILKKFYKTNNINDYAKAKKIFIGALIITLLIYLYFTKKYQTNYYEKLIKNKESFPSLIRLLGGIFLVVGITCLLYYQVTADELSGETPI